MSGPVEGFPVNHQARAVLHHPDQRTSWIILLAADLLEPLGDLTGPFDALAASAPITAARLAGPHWVSGPPASLLSWDGDPLADARLVRRFDLEHEPPIRVIANADRTRVALAGHHAALDGLGMVGVLSGLLGAAVAASEPVASGSAPSNARAARRRLAPADRVARSPGRHASDALIARAIAISGPSPTARLAAACAAAAAAHNARVGSRWRRVGLSLGVGGQLGVGNTASYRRVDVAGGDDIEAAVREVLAGPAVHGDSVPPSKISRVLSPVVNWFSDSILVSNLGRLGIAGVRSLEFFPVARGRSAVSFGAAGLVTGGSTLTIRARDLSSAAAAVLLDDAVNRFEGSGSG